MKTKFIIAILIAIFVSLQTGAQRGCICESSVVAETLVKEIHADQDICLDCGHKSSYCSTHVDFEPVGDSVDGLFDFSDIDSFIAVSPIAEFFPTERFEYYANKAPPTGERPTLHELSQKLLI